MMDSSEKLVEMYLRHLGFKVVEYEPDGRIPPDFLADGRVAVEVRRLNQNHDDGTGKGPRGLEETAIPIWRHMRDYLTGLGPPTATGQSWFIFYSFGRPRPAWKHLKRELDTLLLPFMGSADPQPFKSKLAVSGEFWIEVLRASNPMPTFFCPAGYTDKQSGGWLIAEMDVNIKHCIVQKSNIIAKYKTKYPEWWLVLPDLIGYGLGEFDRQLFLDHINVEPLNFDKIILLDPRDATRAFKIYG